MSTSLFLYLLQLFYRNTNKRLSDIFWGSNMLNQPSKIQIICFVVPIAYIIYKEEDGWYASYSTGCLFSQNSLKT